MTAPHLTAVPAGRLLADVTAIARAGDLDAAVTHFSSDSREIEAGGLFVATRGFTADGHDFIDRALAQGAAGVVAETPVPADLPAGRCWVRVEDATYALAVIADAFYGHPSRDVPVLATTGTNGKTTVSWILYDVLRHAGGRPGLLSTVEVRFGETRRPTIFTTPPAPDFQRLLWEMKQAGCTAAVVEASSHGLQQYRMAAFRVAVGSFTNLTRDHLDYHETMAAYLAAKARLFTDLADRAVFNVDDDAGLALSESFSGTRLTLSPSGDRDADIRTLERHFDLSGCRARVATPRGPLALETRLIGAHNLENALVALGMAYLAGVPLDVAAEGLREARGARGRLEPVPGPRRVFVDYAHTPDALENVLSALRPLVGGRLICVFGAGGDRDKGKRPQMARAAASLADLTVVTSDNPRTEDPTAIIADILPGLPDAAAHRVEVDREAAIRWAIATAGDEDAVLIAGKGHEDYQIIGTERRSFDDVEVARRAMEGVA